MQVTICDVCKTQKTDQRIFIVTGRSSTPAGDREDDGTGFDICGGCGLKVLRQIIDHNRYDEYGLEIIKYIRAISK